MALPGWNNLDSVKQIESAVHIGSLCCWVALFVCEAIAHFWKKREGLFNVFALIAFALAISGEWADFKYDNRKEVLYEAQQQSQKDDYDRKLQQANTEAHNARTDAQQAQGKAQQSASDANQAQQRATAAEQDAATLKYQQGYRELSQDQRTRLIAFLKPYAPQKYVYISSPDAEATEYGDELVDALKSAGWEASGPSYNWGTITHQGQGVLVEVLDTTKPAPRGAAALQTALRSVGIDAGGSSFPMVGPDGFLLYVGLRPKTPNGSK
jgi:hypothetical protein